MQNIISKLTDPISMDNAMLLYIAKEMAFINSVTFGTNANMVKPKNFSSMCMCSTTGSTESTKISAMAEKRTVQANNTKALLALLQFGASCPP